MCRGAYKGLLYIKILSFPRGPLSVFFLLPLLHPRVGAYIPHSIRRASLRRVYQTSLKTFVSFLLSPGAVVKKTQRAPNMTASNTVFSVFSGIGFFLAVVPLYWHLEAWNVGTCMYMIWTALACLVSFVDSIVWNGNAINWAPVWCDIGTFIHVFIFDSYL